MPEATMNSVHIEELEARQGRIGVITLNSPKTLNSLTLDMVKSIAQQLRAWQDDDGIALVMLRGMGDKAFCAGGDVQQLYHSAIAQPGGPCEYAEAFFLYEYDLDYLIHTYAKPIACVGHGIVMGGGLGLMAGADFRIATETTRIAMPEITIGLFPDVGGTWFLNRMPRGLGNFFALTGARINAVDALYTQLATHVLPQSSLAELPDILQSQRFSDDVEANRHTIAEVLKQLSFSSQALNREIESEIHAVLHDLEHACQCTSLGEMIQAFNQMADQSTWLEQAVATLRDGSAISSLIIYEQLKRHRYSTLEKVFLSEYQLATNVVRYPEFTEGVRALLIDKDKQPNWQYAHFSAVPASLLEHFFTPPWKENPLATLIP